MHSIYREEPSGVFWVSQFVSGELATYAGELRAMLKERGLTSGRLCFHNDRQSPLQVMLILQSRASAYPAHLHRRRTELYTMVEGEATFVMQQSTGKVLRTSLTGAQKSACIVPAGTVHMLEPLTPEVVFLEVAPGPFDVSDIEYAQLQSP